MESPILALQVPGNTENVTDQCLPQIQTDRDRPAEEETDLHSRVSSVCVCHIVYAVGVLGTLVLTSCIIVMS